jgi:hypothetical protein
MPRTISCSGLTSRILRPRMYSIARLSPIVWLFMMRSMLADQPNCRGDRGGGVFCGVFGVCVCVCVCVCVLSRHDRGLSKQPGCAG